MSFYNVDVFFVCLLFLTRAMLCATLFNRFGYFQSHKFIYENYGIESTPLNVADGMLAHACCPVRAQCLPSA